MSEPQDYEFRIDAFTPETMPMARLARYLTDLATMLGNHSGVHLIGIEKGSVKPQLRVDATDVPKVDERIRAVRQNDAQPQVMRAYRAIDARLARDNARGALVVKGTKVIEFPGRDRLQEIQPFSQPGSLVGVVKRLGGRDNPPTLLLEDEDRSYICHASKDVIRRIAPNIYGGPVRVTGIGRWERNQTSEWCLVRFTIHHFEKLKNTPLDELVTSIRDSGASHWGDADDPLAELQKLRHGE